MEGLFEYYIETEDMHLKYAKGEPSIKDKELHLYHELVWFLGGSSRFISGSVQRDLTPESIVVIPKEKFHRFRVDNGSEYVRCILGFRETPDTCELIRKVMTDVRILTKPDKKILYQFSQLTEAVKSELSQGEKQLFIKSALVQILICLLQSDLSKSESGRSDVSDMVKQAIAYIDENYAKKLSVSSIAEQLYVSPSTLAHKFSEELNISIYRYISKKRLFEAELCIEKGESLSSAAEKNGFNDYSCFYRMYKKYSAKEAKEQ